MISRDRIFVSIVDESCKESLFTEKIDFNLELALFSIPEVLDEDCSGLIARVRSVLDKNKVKCALHGPFNELYYNSRDAEIRRVVEKRFLQIFDIAGRLNAEHVVFHSTYNQFIVRSDYYSRWLNRSVEFWEKMIKKAEEKKIIAAIENVWDDCPERIKGLIEKIRSPYLKICFDCGHANIFSKTPMDEWMDVFDKDLQCLHIHNNFGKTDDHFELSKGDIDITGLIRYIEEKKKLQPIYTIEVNVPEEARKSLEFLKNANLV